MKIPLELAKSVVIGKKIPDLPLEYSIPKSQFSYNGEKNVTTELHSDQWEKCHDLWLMASDKHTTSRYQQKLGFKTPQQPINKSSKRLDKVQ